MALSSGTRTMRTVLAAACAALLALTAGCVCPPGEAKCSDGCISLEEDVDNCGGCGFRCGGGQICRGGECLGGGPVCTSDSSCDDRRFCNGREECVAGVCRSSPPPPCDDGDPCTTERCDDASGQCISTPGACP